MDTRVLLIRCGVTDWHEHDKLVGRHDAPLSIVGSAQAERVAELLAANVDRVSELICSPLQRALETAREFERRSSLHLARDQRLTALSWGSWEGRTPDELAEDPAYRQFLARPTEVRPPGGEGVDAARRRAVAAVEQAIGDATAGDVLALVTHGTIIRMLLAHYLGAPAMSCQRMRVDPCSVSVLSFGYNGAARVSAINWQSPLAVLLADS